MASVPDCWLPGEKGVVSLQREYTRTTAARGRASLELRLPTQLDDAPSGCPE